jgi:glycosyltransferase involved in cell wall biosynthesis
MARQALADRDAEIGRARHSIEVLADEIETARAAHQARDHEDDGMRQALRDRDAEVARARAHIEALTAEIARARAAHEARDATEAELRAALSAREAEVEDARRNIASLAGELDRARESHRARDLVELELRRQLRAGEDDLERAFAAARTLAVDVEQRDQAVSNALREAEAAHAELVRRAQDEARLAADLAEQQAIERELEMVLSETEREADDLARQVRLLAGKRWYRFAHRLLGIRLAAPGPVADPALGPFGVDSMPDALESGEREVTGWYVPPPGVSVRRVSIRAGRRRFEGAHGLTRPDVAAAYPALADAAASGFRIRVNLPAGDHRLVLEVQHGDGSWHLLGARHAQARRPPLRAHFDQPVEWTVARGEVRFSGWCCHPQARVARVCVSIAGASIECAYGLPRADVAARFPDHPGSLLSGFDVTWRLRPGRGDVALHAELETGEVLTYAAPRPIVVLPLLLHAPAARTRSAAETGLVWTRLARAAWTRYRQRGELPGLDQVARRLRDAARTQRLRQRSHPLEAPVAEDPRESWQRVNAWHDRAEADLRRRLSVLAERLRTVSLLWAGATAHLQEAVCSLEAQPFEDWELCVVADAGDEGTCSLLKTLVASHARVRARCLSPAGTRADAWNAAAAMATGDLLVVVGAAVPLAPGALGELALEAAQKPEADLYYTDHEREGTDGAHFQVFKPGWSPERLLSEPYLGEVFAIRRAAFRDLGGFRDIPGAESFDLQLRAAERPSPAAHLALVGYRVGDPAAADRGEAVRRAVDDALARRGLAAHGSAGAWPEARAVPLVPLTFPHEGPTVAVIVSAAQAGAAWDRAQTVYRNLCVVSTRPGPWTTAALKNRAVREVEAEYLLFVDGALRPTDPGWLSVLAGYGRMPGVGVVGARLRLPDGKLQHAGFTFGSTRGRPGPVLIAQDGPDEQECATNRLAVSGACLLTPRRLFEEMGGFDEGPLADAYHDLDYCLRLAARGYRTVCAPVELVLARDLATELFIRVDAEAEFRRRYRGHRDGLASPHLEARNGRWSVRPRRLARPPHARVRALMCSFNLNREGAPLSQFELTVRLKDDGVLDPVVFCPEDGPLREAYRERAIEVHVGPHPLAGVFDATAYDRAVSCFASFVRECGVDLVYGNTVHTFYAVAAAEHLGLPSIWNPRESETIEAQFSHLAPEIGARARECFRYPYRVVFVAEATRQVYAALESASNFTVVHNGLDRARLDAAAARWTRADARRSLGVAEQEVLFLLLGTVCERKGQVDLPLALARLPEQAWRRLRCVIVGDRGLPYSRRVHAARDGLPATLGERVRILPETADTARLYRAADVFVCTSRVESFPRVTLEAMAHGLPLVTTPVYGIAEQVRDGVNALQYEPGDVAGLAAALARLLEDEPLRLRLAAHAGHVLDCLNDFDDMAAAYAEIFREAALSRGRPVRIAGN